MSQTPLEKASKEVFDANAELQMAEENLAVAELNFEDAKKRMQIASMRRSEAARNLVQIAGEEQS